MRSRLTLGVTACFAVGGCEAALGLGDLHDRQADGAAVEDVAAPDVGASDGAADSDSADVQGDASDAGLDAAPDADAAPLCASGSARCVGQQPQTCQNGQWTNDGSPCGGGTPVCSNGVCGSYRATGGVRTTAPAVGDGGALPDGGYRVRAGGFEFVSLCDAGACAPRACNANGLCVTGGIVP